MNCCFILRPQFGQIRLLALIKVYWSLATISSADIPLVFRTLQVGETVVPFEDLVEISGESIMEIDQYLGITED